jgi:hypothetical protein
MSNELSVDSIQQIVGILFSRMTIVCTVIGEASTAFLDTHSSDVSPSTLVYLESTKGWAIRVTPVAYGQVIITRLNQRQGRREGTSIVVD